MNSKLVVSLLVVAACLLAATFFLPWQRVDWGKIQFSPAKTITVSGQAKSQERSQIATFTAGVSAVNDDKDTAVNEVNQKVATIIAAVKDFGIPEKDIKTQNLSVYQAEETYYEEGIRKQRPGQWRVSNSISITLRDVDQASALANLLSGSGATNVHGPNFTADDTQTAETALLAKAIASAREKAKVIAEASGGKLGKVISVTEGTRSQPIFRALEAGGVGGGAPIEPGSSTVSQTVTVIFEIK